MTPEELNKWLSEYTPGSSAAEVTLLITQDPRWLNLTVNEKLTLILLAIGRVRT